MSKKSICRITTFSLALVISLSGFAVKYALKANSYRNYLTNEYNNSLNDLTDYLCEINDNLEKQIYSASTKEISKLSAKLMSETTGAKNSLSFLPVDVNTSESIYKFLSQAGNYSLALSNKTAKGEKLSNQEKENLEKMKKYADMLYRSFSDIQLIISEKNDWQTDIDSKVENLLNGKEINSFYKSIEDISQTDTDYPTLIYDGPFSDHINSAKSELLKSSPEYSMEKCKQIAADYLSCDKSELKYSKEENSNTKAYIFQNETAVAAITEKGGYCLYFKKTSEESEKNKISEKNAVQIAKAYAEDYFQKKFSQSYYLTSNGICTVNLAYTDGEYIYYPDLIKVDVSLASGEITGLEARGYIMNHKERTEHKAKYTVQQAQAVLSDNLKVKSSGKAVINSESLKEYHCYEFICKGKNNEDIIVYINDTTLDEEDILILINTSGGVLTR